MADDSDVPPLEDMTEVLKQANAIREQLDKSGEGKIKNTQKTKAKVNKKHPTARAVPSTEVKDETLEDPEKKEEGNNGKEKSESLSVIDNAKPVPKPIKDAGGLFGGMKKGFLFDASSKPSAKPSPSTTHSNKNRSGGRDEKKSSEAPTNKMLSVPKRASEEIPYIAPKEKTESGLTFNEVQQAMSEAKGLLDNQDWITDDFLNKIEKNDFLLKRFSDPHFMTALQEFQTNPEAAMAKYKGNKEVEKFLSEFCGLLGNHFTNLGATEEKQTKNSSSDQKVTYKAQEPKQNQAKTPGKIVELDDDVTENQTSPVHSISPLDKLTNVNKQRTSAGLNQDIKIHNVEHSADIQEIKSSSDEEIKDVLNDPKVMETLMDPQIMRLIQTLKDDPVKGQRLVNEASSDFRSKIQFLVSKGLLQFQTG